MEVHINTYGGGLRVRGEIFVVTLPDITGAGNDVQKEFAPHQVNAFTLYTRGCSVSSDAVALAAANGVSIIFTDKLGQSIGRMNYEMSAADIEVQLGQLSLVGKPQSIEYAKQWLGTKFKRKMHFLGRLERYRDGEKLALLQATRLQLAQISAQLKALPTTVTKENMASIRGFEGNGSKLYFDTLSKLLPPEYQYDGRSRRPAQDIFNAFLNFGYGVLYNQVENALCHYGIHPYIGFFHSMQRRQKAMLFDFIEPYRPWMDNLVFSLCSRKQITRGHVQEHENGLWLNKDGISLLLETFHDAFDKAVIEVQGNLVSYKLMLYREAESFARQMRQIWQQRFGENLTHSLSHISGR